MNRRPSIRDRDYHTETSFGHGGVVVLVPICVLVRYFIFVARRSIGKKGNRSEVTLQSCSCLRDV